MRRTLCILMTVALLLVGTACSEQVHPTTAPSAGAGLPVRVYFMRAGKVAAAGRRVADPSKRGQTVQSLLSGPDDFERSLGMSTAIPPGTKMLSLGIADGTATADLSNEFESGDSVSGARIAEIVYTLTQFEDVHRVTLTVNGKSIDGAVNLQRGDLAAETPRILVESPTPGESVTSPLEVSGAANVFEGTVSYLVNGPDGVELDHGFTTAVQQEWAGWFAFAFRSAYVTQQHGIGHIVVWETSMKDGSRLNVYDVPVNL